VPQGEKLSVKRYKKRDFAVHNARRILEPGPIVLVSSHWKGESNIMTMGWYTVMEFVPSLVGCIIASSNHSFELIKKSKECVINVPGEELIEQVIDIGNNSGSDIDKFDEYNLTSTPGTKVKAPVIEQCFAGFECKIYDNTLIDSYNYFIFEIVKAHAAARIQYPRTLHYHGQGEFTVSGKTIERRSQFTKWKNQPNF
jgi:flavin reductase (DIM6/NTAB) family NADH-FMN oxidoreductase RutF